MSEEQPIIETIGDQTTNLNEDQIDEARAFLSQRYGNFCGAGSDKSEGCGHTVKELEALWIADYVKRNKPIPTRKHPFLIINEKKGRGLHRAVNGFFQYCGNVNYFCKSCNMIYSRRVDDIVDDSRVSYNVMKSKKVRVPFRNKLREFLKDNTHACMKEVFNKWSGSDEFKTTQETLQNAYEQDFDIAFDEISISEYGIECGYKKCNGTHIILKGEPPLYSKEEIEKFR